MSLRLTYRSAGLLLSAIVLVAASCGGDGHPGPKTAARTAAATRTPLAGSGDSPELQTSSPSAIVQPSATMHPQSPAEAAMPTRIPTAVGVATATHPPTATRTRPPAPSPTETPEAPTIRIVSPAQMARVPASFPVEVLVTGIELALGPNGELVPGAAHWHAGVDGHLLPGAQSDTSITVRPEAAGSHTISVFLYLNGADFILVAADSISVTVDTGP